MSTLAPPMLACRESVHLWHDDKKTPLRYPVFGGPKLDGLRCTIHERTARSRSLKPIPNLWINNSFGQLMLEGLDGELIVGNVTDPSVYIKSESGVMTRAGEPDFSFWVFDDVTERTLEYSLRRARMIERVSNLREANVFKLEIAETFMYESWDDILKAEALFLELGYEGMILRAPFAQYKNGRSTAREQGMLKLKRFVDGECVVIGFEELMRNGNEAFTNELGRTARSKAAEGMIPGGTLGRMKVRDLVTNDEFEIGMFKGLTNGDKQQIWDHQDLYLGRTAKYSHFAIGAKDLPRHAKFIGWRSAADMS